MVKKRLYVGIRQRRSSVCYDVWFGQQHFCSVIVYALLQEARL
jgi:hypothetical protein